MAKRIALIFLALASPLVLICFLIGGAVAELCFTVLAMAYPVALIVLAVARDSGLGPLRLPLLILLLILEGSGAAMLVMRGGVMDGLWIGGLPAAAAVLLYGIWLLPLPLVAFAYALTFDHYGLPEDELQRLEALGRDEGRG